MEENKSKKKSIKYGIKPSQVFPYLFLLIGALFIFFIVLFPSMFTPVTVYRRAEESNNYSLYNYQERLNNIYSESNTAIKYEKIQSLKKETIEKKGIIDEKLTSMENKIVNEGINNINNYKSMVDDDPFKYLPTIDELIKIYEQIPSLSIGKVLDGLKDNSLNKEKSGEREILKEYKGEYYYFDPDEKDAYIMESEKLLTEKANKILNYLKARIRIAKGTKDDEWAYNIMKETFSMYITSNSISFEKLRSNEIKDIFNELKNEASLLIKNYGEIKKSIQMEIDEARKIFYSDEDIETIFQKLDKNLFDTKDMEKTLRLERVIFDDQSTIVSKYYDGLEAKIINLLIKYKDKGEYHNILNDVTVKQMKEMFNKYIEKDFVLRFPSKSRIIEVKEANEYLKIITKINIKYSVFLKNIKLSSKLDNISVHIGLYDNSKDYNGEKIKIYNKTQSITTQNTSSKYVYKFNEELLFPWELGKQIIIRFYSNHQYILSLSSNDKANSPLTYSIANEKGNHFLIFEQKSIFFKWNNKEYEMQFDMDTSNLPKFPALFIELFK